MQTLSNVNNRAIMSGGMSRARDAHGGVAPQVLCQGTYTPTLSDSFSHTP